MSDQVVRNDADGSAAPQATVVLVKLDGKEYVQGSPVHVAALESRNDAAQVTINAKDKQIGELTAKVDSLTADLAKAKAVNVDALVADELAFRAALVPVLPKSADGKPYSFAGKSRTQVKRDAVGAEVCAKVDALPEAQREGYLAAKIDDALAKAAAAANAPGYVAPNPNDPANTSRADALPSADFSKSLAEKASNLYFAKEGK